MHYGTHLCQAFCDWVEDGMPSEAECEEAYRPVTWPAENSACCAIARTPCPVLCAMSSGSSVARRMRVQHNGCSLNASGWRSPSSPGSPRRLHWYVPAESAGLPLSGPAVHQHPGPGARRHSDTRPSSPLP
jgi:hypothetical protein